MGAHPSPLPSQCVLRDARVASSSG
jgi:hypothetical protein